MTSTDDGYRALRLSYALSKQLPTAHTLESSYGALELDETLRRAIERAVRPILERRLNKALKEETPSHCNPATDQAR